MGVSTLFAVGAAVFIAAVIAAAIGVSWIGKRADALPGEEPPETMAHMRGPGI